MKISMASIALLATLFVPAFAWAGEVKFGPQPLETDDSGKITAAGRSAAVEDLPSEPGEDIWVANVWISVDRGGAGPIYVEFHGKLPDGKPYLAYRHEHAEYDGGPFVSFPIELDANVGFNKGKTYTVKVTQVSGKGKTMVLATGKVTLVYTEPAPEPEGEAGGDESEEEIDEEQAKQDELDTLSETPEGDDGPPPVDSKGKKGCSIGAGTNAAPGVLVLFALGAAAGRRRRASR